MINLNELLNRIAYYMGLGQRKGQSLSNAIFDLDPKFYIEINGTILDCYFNDKVADKVIKLYEERLKNKESESNG